MEGHAKRAILARHGHAFFLHRLQQRRLGARAGAVDLVGHQKLAKHRTGHKAEIARAVLGLFEHLGAEDIGGHQIGGELDARAVQPHHRAERFDKPRFAQTGKADQKRMTTAQKRRKRQVDNPLLPDEPRGDRGFGLGQLGLQGFDLRHQIGRLYRRSRLGGPVGRHGKTPQ